MTEGAWNNLGVYLRDTRRDLAGAQGAFQKALALRPDYYAALFNMAVLARSRGDEKAAQGWLFRSITAVGGDPAPAVLEWARESEKRGDARAARAVLEKAQRAYPANEDITRALAMRLFRDRDCAQGLTALARFEGQTKNPSTLNVLALLHTCLGNRSQVVRLLRRSLDLRPDQPDVARSLRAAESGR
jgi:Flp pilus assembly protein TadD